MQRKMTTCADQIYSLLPTVGFKLFHDSVDVILYGVLRKISACYAKESSSLSRLRGTIESKFPTRSRTLQIKVLRELPNANQFVGFIDAIGELDGVHCLLGWKTTSSRYSEAPEGLLPFDRQLICYSWLTGISEAGLVVFVRKRQPEVQYLRTTIFEKQREEYGRVVVAAIEQIERKKRTCVSWSWGNTCVRCAPNSIGGWTI